jgi:hypothetical protein
VRALRVIVFALAVLAASHGARCEAATGAGEDPRTAAATVAHDLRVQETLPSESGDAPRARYDESDLGGTGGAAPAGGAGAAAGAFSQVFVWAGLGLVALFVLATLAEALPSRRAAAAARARARTEDDEARGARAGTPQRSLASADELAAAGRYTEAIHQLLSDALAVLRRRIGGELSDALTSREILRMTKLRDAEHDALGEIILRVEQTWFAQRLAAAEDYEAVRASFRAFSGAGASA